MFLCWWRFNCSGAVITAIMVVTLSVCQSVCHFSILEKAPFSGLKLTSVYILGDDLSPLNVALF